MKFTLASLVALTAGLQLIAAQELSCCYYGPPSSCHVVSQNPRSLGTFVERGFVPAGAANVVRDLSFGPGPECCCKPDASGDCSYCVSDRLIW